MAGRKRSINAATETTHADVQDSITALGAVGDEIPNQTQTDSSNVNNTLARADETEKAAVGDQIFEEMYRKSTVRGRDYMRRSNVGNGRTALIPPACVLHPRLGLWALRYGGRWMVIRWVQQHQRNRQKRFEQGWQYFEGTEWCRRLGLNPEAYINEKGRISTGDVELAWASDEYMLERFSIAEETRKERISEVRERLVSMSGGSGPKVELLEGDDAAVLGELHDRRRYAESR